MNMLMTGVPKGYVRNPDFIHPDQIPDLYALRGVGTCMEPLIEDGALLAFNKAEPLLQGDTVNIWFHPDRVKPGSPQGMIKRYGDGAPLKVAEGVGEPAVGGEGWASLHGPQLLGG